MVMQRIHPPSVLPQEPQPGGVLAEGLQQHRAGNLVLAEQAYRACLSAQPEHPQALAFLANALARRGHFQLAIKCASRALRNAPYLGEARFILGAGLLGLSHSKNGRGAAHTSVGARSSSSQCMAEGIAGQIWNLHTRLFITTQDGAVIESG